MLLDEMIVFRAGRPCGLLFSLKGPRLLATHAIWPADEDRVLFYDSTGVRFTETSLSDAPDAPRLAA
jgi:hypothetical protein